MKTSVRWLLLAGAASLTLFAAACGSDESGGGGGGSKAQKASGGEIKPGNLREHIRSEGLTIDLLPVPA